MQNESSSRYFLIQCTYALTKEIYIIKIFISTSLNKKILLSIFISFYHTQKHICYFHHKPYERDILEHVLEFIDVATNINDK